ncbi:MAG TPA: 3-isopropylmalate dehydrogenase [Candidatus Tectomicrobia bacterium]|nr:3-isopropylmalate dehydrogenase [Candidatus Tectomicrobia bacterium]
MSFRVAVLPGDGIGPEVVAQGVEILRKAAAMAEVGIELKWGVAGGRAIDESGDPLPDSTLQLCRESDGILFGAVGGPKWDNIAPEIRPERGLLRLRQALGLFANLRPAKVFTALVDASPLKRELVEALDILIVRELTGDIYYGEPRGITAIAGGERSVNTMVYTTAEIDRIVRLAFEVAQQRGRRVTSVDKANVLETSRLWRKVVEHVAEDFPGITYEHMYVDNAAMQLVRAPKQFDVIVTGNLFGDILSDEAAMVTGSIGLAASASLGSRTALYEPVHGSAPDIAGQGVANPLATILSVAMLFKYTFKLDALAGRIEAAVEEVLAQGYRTRDIRSPGTNLVGTAEMGMLVRKALG